MLTIRNEQMRVLARLRRANFAIRMVRYLEEALPARNISLDPTELPAMVDAAIDEAQRYGIERERDAARFIELACRYRHAWKRHAWPVRVQRLLSASGLNPVERIDRLENWLSGPAGAGPDRL